MKSAAVKSENLQDCRVPVDVAVEGSRVPVSDCLNLGGQDAGSSEGGGPSHSERMTIH